MNEYYSYSIEKTLSILKTSKSGLSSDEVLLRRAENKEIKFGHKSSLASKFASQFKDLMILILLLSATVSITIGVLQRTSGELVDGLIILFIVIMNAIFGVVQENKAEKSMEALKKMTEPETFVMREGIISKINVKKLVEGDVVVLDAGSIVPADLRLIECAGLMIDEASLTGESMASEKRAEKVYKQGTPLADRRNMAYKGCVVSGGRGLGVVTALGAETEFGKIAKAISLNDKEMTPLQKSIKDVGKVLTIMVLLLAAITFIIELITKPGLPMQAFLTAIAISVAAIPESMPAVITIIMSIGIARLAKQKAVVKRMHAVETLGCCDVICSDKTGTITQNKMSVVATFCDERLQQGKIIRTQSFDRLIQCMLLCNNTQTKGNKIVGDPTEIAISRFGSDFGINKSKFELARPRLDELPFDSKRKLMSTANEIDGQFYMFTKGALDKILDKCESFLSQEKIKALGSEEREKILNANKAMAGKALRVIALAYKSINKGEKLREEGLTFIGLVGLIDPPRKEIKNAVRKCIKAGMRPVMITGDHKDTAFAIAKEIGIASEVGEVMTGIEIDSLDDQSLIEKIEKVSVYARVSPDNKVRIVSLLKKKGHVVAMTGDGVNDAPSLKKASIGIGMGITGTDVTKEVADMIVTDDNFATIVVAVEEGRKIYQNIQKTVKFLFSANMGEILSLFFATILFPKYVFLFPVQILFVNLITDSLPAVALGVEPPEKDLMSTPPRNSKESMFAGGMGWSIAVLGLVQTFLTLTAYYIGIKSANEATGITMAFYTLNIIQMFYLMSMRTNGNMFKSNPFKNKMFVLAIIFGFGLLAIIALSPLKNLLKLVDLSLMQWGAIFLVSIVMMFASELFKVVNKLIKK